MAPQFANDTMAYEYGSASYIDEPGRMFKTPIGPSPEEDRNAPFYVPRGSVRPYPDTRDYDEGQHYPQDQSYDKDLWRPSAQRDEYQSEMDHDQSYSHRPSRSMNHDRKPSNFPYPKQQRDRSKERYAAPNISKARRYNGSGPTNRGRRGTSSINRRQGSRETSVPHASQPITSQQTRQPSHAESAPAPPRPLSRPNSMPHSPVSREQGLPPSAPQPVSSPSIPTGPRMWNSSPPHTMQDAPKITTHAMSILDHMLEKQSAEDILHMWECTGLGPNPYDYPQWKGWNSEM